jgi:hypothetical protein
MLLFNLFLFSCASAQYKCDLFSAAPWLLQAAIVSRLFLWGHPFLCAKEMGAKKYYKFYLS